MEEHGPLRFDGCADYQNLSDNRVIDELVEKGMAASKFYSLVITSEAIYYEGRQVGWVENADDLPKYMTYLATPLPDEGKIQSWDWEVPSWLTHLRYKLYVKA